MQSQQIPRESSIMINQKIETSLGQMAVTASFPIFPKATLFFWSGMFFDGTMWDPILEMFYEDYNVVVIDPPGHGGSHSPQNIFSIAECATIVSEILGHYHLDSCIFVGLSWGGFVGQSFVKFFPQKCNGLVLINTCASAPTTFEKIVFSILPSLLSRFGVKSFEGTLANALLSKSTAMNNHALMAKLRNALRFLDYNALKPTLLSVMKHRENLVDCIDTQDLKCLVIWGNQDNSISKSRSSELISLTPTKAKIKELDVGHNAVLEAPKEVTSALLEFLE